MAKKMKRSLALLLALVMCLGMLPMSVFAAEATAHEHNQDGWVCTRVTEDTRTLVCDKHVHDENCYTTERGDLTCEQDVHEHTDDCYAVVRGELTCEITEHTHTGDCRDENGELICGLEAHTHGDDCYAAARGELTCTETEHTHGDGCYEVVTVKVCGEEDHEHTDDCYEVVEGEWSCTNVVGNFLAAVAAIPAEINADNAAEAGELVNAAFDAYEVLVDAGLDGYDGVADALAKVEAAYVAIDEALEMGSSTFSGYWHDGDSLAGFGAAIGYDPKDASKFPATDGTYISVIPWDFHNPDHAKDYYYYIDYRLDYQPRTEPAPDPVQNSYFEKTYNWTNLRYYAPLEFSKTAAAGATGSLSWRQGVTNFNDSAGGLVPTIPSVYLYRLEEVTGTEYITGGRDGITFKANDEVKLESSGGPVYRPTGPYIQCDVPVSESAPKGAKIQVRFRLAMGYEMEWQPSEGTYDWYVQDFILNLTVGESGGSTVDPDVDATHHVYMPAGTSTTIELYKPFYGYEELYEYLYGNGYYRSGNYSIKSKEVTQNGDENVATAGTLTIGNASDGGNVLRVPISSSANAEKDATTEICVKYVYGSERVEQTEKIIVHIIQPREQEIEAGKTVTVPVLGNSSQGDFSSIKKPTSNTVATVSNVTASGYKATGKANASGSATSEYQYLYCKETEVGVVGIEYVSYVEQTVYVDVTNFTIPSNDDPDTIDGLDIAKTADKMSVVGGDEITYIITVTNDSSVDKTVTVTDPLPNGTTFKSFDPNDGTAVLAADGYNVTWTPTVPAKGSSVLRITCTVADNVRGYLTNVARMETANGDKDEATVQPTATPKPTTYTVRWMGVDEDQGTPTTENLPWVQLHSETGVTAGSEPTWATVKENHSLTDPKSYTLDGKTYTWNGQWTEEWNAGKTVKTFWAVYVEQGGTGGDNPDPKDFTITVDKTITAVNGKAYTPGTKVNDGDKVTYQVVVTNNTAKDLTLHDLVIWDVMDKGLTMTGDPKGTVVGNDGNANHVVYKGSATYVENGVATDKTAHYWQLAGTFKRGASVTLIYTDTVSHDSHDEATLHNVAYALGYTVEAETQQNQKSRRAAFDPSTLFDPDRENQKVEGSSGAGVAGGGSGQQITVGGKPCTVTFDPNGGNWNGSTDNKTVNVKKGETVGNQMPADPARDKYEFTGWNTKPDGSGDTFTKDTPINSDVTVYAQWKEKEEEAWTLWRNNDVGETGKPTLAWTKGHVDADAYASANYHGDGYKADPADLTCEHDGYTFYGWVYNEDEVTDWIVTDDAGNEHVLHNVKVYNAVFKGSREFTVQKLFDGAGLTVNNLPEEFTLEYYSGVDSNRHVTLKAEDATKITVDGKPGYQWKLNVDVLSWYWWTYCWMEETNAEIDGYTMTGTSGWKTRTWDDGSVNHYFEASAAIYDYHEKGNTFTLTNSYTKLPSVTVNYVTDDETPVSLGSIKYYPADGTEYNHSKGDGTTVPTVGNKDTKSPASITVGDNTYAYDKVLTNETTLTGTMGSADVTITVVYSLDVKGGNDPNLPEGGPDGIPDKYQAKVVYTAGAGGTITSATKSEYLTIKDANGNMATTGTIAITGATAAPTGDNHFVNWTAAATKDNDWSYTPSTEATLAGFNISDAKGGEEYTFTANFEANPGTPLEVKAPDVTVIYNGEEHPVAPTTNKGGATVTVTYVDENGNPVDVPKDAGKYTATIVAKLEDEETDPITATVTINKATLTVTTESASKVYDGTALTAPGSISGLVDGEATFAVTGSQTEVGSSSNAYTLTWADGAKASNYVLTETLGTLTVTNAPVIVIPDPVDTTYTVTYDPNGGEGGPGTQSQVNSNVVTIPSAVPTREGYTFQGWATTPDGAAVYQPGSSFTITGLSQTLYAVWQEDEEDITEENPPLTDLPDTGDDKPDVDLPKDPTEDLPDEEEISDGDVPLTDVPKTGDHTNRFLVMAAVSGLCLLTLLSGRRKEDEA